MSNTGKNNTGNENTGNENTGNENTGHRNTGHWNTGHRNTGDWNTGDRNTGDRNTGHWNTGDWNTGHWNTCNKETGYFNTAAPETVRVFNKSCSLEDWENADKPDFIYFELAEWIYEPDMTAQEKIDNDTYKTTGGYLKSYEYKEAFQKAYDAAPQSDKDKLLKLPNFDAEVFKEISGIDVRQQTCAGKVVEIDGKKYKLTGIEEN